MMSTAKRSAVYRQQTSPVMRLVVTRTLMRLQIPERNGGPNTNGCLGVHEMYWPQMALIDVNRFAVSTRDLKILWEILKTFLASVSSEFSRADHDFWGLAIRLKWTISRRLGRRSGPGGDTGEAMKKPCIAIATDDAPLCDRLARYLGTALDVFVVQASVEAAGVRLALAESERQERLLALALIDLRGSIDPMLVREVRSAPAGREARIAVFVDEQSAGRA